tara:strand:- start:1028 stop:1201 length:174 start_codon:yes stop_codon:yes gene_type:complete
MVKNAQTTWAVYDDGLKVWFDGELVAKIDPSQFKYILADLALWLKHNEGKDESDGSF